jgi:adenylosuccinate lyase
MSTPAIPSLDPKMAYDQDAVIDLQRQIDKMKQQIGTSVFDTYQTSLTGRYCSQQMSQLFSQRSRHSTWRKLWLYLAEAEKELGIETISEEALQQMRDNLTVTDADFETARVEEKRRRHDVMAHVHAFGEVAPKAAGIIHYGVRCTLRIRWEQDMANANSSRQRAAT